MVGAKSVHPDVFVALHLDASNTQSRLVSWLCEVQGVCRRIDDDVDRRVYSRGQGWRDSWATGQSVSITCRGVDDCYRIVVFALDIRRLCRGSTKHPKWNIPHRDLPYDVAAARDISGIASRSVQDRDGAKSFRWRTEWLVNRLSGFVHAEEKGRQRPRGNRDRCTVGLVYRAAGSQ